MPNLGISSTEGEHNRIDRIPQLVGSALLFIRLETLLASSAYTSGFDGWQLCSSSSEEV